MKNSDSMEAELDGGSPVSVQEAEVEDSSETSEGFEETWDLRSPLMQRSPLHSESTPSEPRSHGDPEGYIVMEENKNVCDPWKLCLTICALMMSMLFFGLFVGSFFFPWSDTKFRITMDTVNSIPLDFSVVSIHR